MSSIKSLLPLFAASALTHPACAIATPEVEAEPVGPGTKILHILYSDGLTTYGPAGSLDPCRDAPTPPPAFSCASGPLEACQTQIEQSVKLWLRDFDVEIKTSLPEGEEADYTAIIGGTNRAKWCGLPQEVTGYTDVNCTKRPRQTFYVMKDGARNQALLLAHEFGHANGLVHDVQDPVSKKLGIMYPALIELPPESIYPLMNLPATSKNHCGRVMQNEYAQMMSSLGPSKTMTAQKEPAQSDIKPSILAP